MKLPSIQKIGPGRWQPTRLRIDTGDLQRMRRNLLLDALVSYRPDVVLVDHMPGGAQGELIPALHSLKRDRPECFIVLGLRDILDAPEVIMRVWENEGFYDVLNQYYDRILIYGNGKVFDTAGTYRIPTPHHGVHYCGYVANSDPIQSAKELRSSLRLGDRKLVFVSAGGGADGDLLMRTYLEAVRLLRSRATFVTLMAPGVHAPSDVGKDLRSKAQRLPVQVVNYVADSMTTLAAADLIVCMAGYNTLSEVLKLRKKAIVVPRIGPSAEQRMRAGLFFSMGLIDVIYPEDLSAQKLAERLLADLERQDYPAPVEAVEMHGAHQAAGRIMELVAMGEYAAAI